MRRPGPLVDGEVRTVIHSVQRALRVSRRRIDTKESSVVVPSCKPCRIIKGRPKQKRERSEVSVPNTRSIADDSDTVSCYAGMRWDY